MPSRKKSTGTSPSHRRNSPSPSATQRASTSGNPNGPPSGTRSLHQSSLYRIAAERRAGDRVIVGNHYGVMSGIGPGQRPRFRSDGRRRGNTWYQSPVDETAFDETSDFPPTGSGRRDGGEFGRLYDPHGQGYQYRADYAGEATTDPDYMRGQLGSMTGRGYGELVPGIEGDSGYGYRSMGSQFALAEWEDGRGPHIPGRGGFVRRDEARADKSHDWGYVNGVVYGNLPGPRGYDVREQTNMRDQLNWGEDGGALHWQLAFENEDERGGEW